MRLEKIVALLPGAVVTDSGVKQALGDKRFHIGDWCWCDGNFVFGHEVAASLISFAPQLDEGFLFLEPDLGNNAYTLKYRQYSGQSLTDDKNAVTIENDHFVDVFCAIDGNDVVVFARKSYATKFCLMCSWLDAPVVIDLSDDFFPAATLKLKIISFSARQVVYRVLGQNPFDNTLFDYSFVNGECVDRRRVDLGVDRVKNAIENNNSMVFNPFSGDDASCFTETSDTVSASASTIVGGVNIDTGAAVTKYINVPLSPDTYLYDGPGTGTFTTQSELLGFPFSLNISRAFNASTTCDTFFYDKNASVSPNYVPVFNAQGYINLFYDVKVSYIAAHKSEYHFLPGVAGFAYGAQGIMEYYPTLEESALFGFNPSLPLYMWTPAAYGYAYIREGDAQFFAPPGLDVITKHLLVANASASMIATDENNFTVYSRKVTMPPITFYATEQALLAAPQQSAIEYCPVGDGLYAYYINKELIGTFNFAARDSSGVVSVEMSGIGLSAWTDFGYNVYASESGTLTTSRMVATSDYRINEAWVQDYQVAAPEPQEWTNTQAAGNGIIVQITGKLGDAAAVEVYDGDNYIATITDEVEVGDGDFANTRWTATRNRRGILMADNCNGRAYALRDGAAASAEWRPSHIVWQTAATPKKHSETIKSVIASLINQALGIMSEA